MEPMHPGIRPRLFILQWGLICVFVFMAILLFIASSFDHSYEHDQLASQKITFPAAGSAALAALPASDAAAMAQFAGQSLDNGDKAKVYADNFIGVHLSEVADGQTYAQVSALAQKSPTDTTLARKVDTLFKGETLRGLLLNAYGWWTVGTYALLAAIGFSVAALVVLFTFFYELYIAPRWTPGWERHPQS